MKSAVVFAGLTGLVAGQLPWSIGQKVKTGSGTVQGAPSSWKPNVSAYLGIPFAQPPVGELRFAPPQPFKGDKDVDGTKFGKACPENVGGKADRSPTSTVNEDCLTLNVWVKPQTGSKSKAVMIWVYGGGFNSGRTSDTLYDGSRLADEQDVVVVSMNYRTNIFGFPRSPALKEKNPGLLDVRLAVEWIRDNVGAFGGDPKRMILFGQSAGGAAVDMYSFAYPKDPIVTGLIAESGLASNPAVLPKNSSAGWWVTSQKVGCGGIEAGDATLACMKKQKWEDILDAVERRGVTPNLDTGFGPQIDNVSVFPDYSKRRQEGNFAHLPLLVGNTNYERAFYDNLAKARGETLPASFRPPEKDGCLSDIAAKSYRAAGVPAWRYLYAGQWAPQDKAQGAGHGAELALVFGQTDRRTSTEEERKLAAVLMKTWADFARDPATSLDKAGWPQYDAQKDTLIRIGGKNVAEIKFESKAKYDKCD